jgi:hypothetical protein
VHQILQKIFFYSFPFWDNYGDDLVAMPIVLRLFTLDQHLFWQKQTTIWKLFVFTLFFALFFEEFLPKINTAYTCDRWDYVAYCVGFCIFILDFKKQ